MAIGCVDGNTECISANRMMLAYHPGLSRTGQTTTEWLQRVVCKTSAEFSRVETKVKLQSKLFYATSGNRQREIYSIGKCGTGISLPRTSVRK